MQTDRFDDRTKLYRVLRKLEVIQFDLRIVEDIVDDDEQFLRRVLDCLHIVCLHGRKGRFE